MAYIPTLGRFLQEDPAGYIDGENRFQIELSSPIRHTDPTGMYDDADDPFDDPDSWGEFNWNDPEWDAYINEQSLGEYQTMWEQLAGRANALADATAEADALAFEGAVEAAAADAAAAAAGTAAGTCAAAAAAGAAGWYAGNALDYLLGISDFLGDAYGNAYADANGYGRSTSNPPPPPTQHWVQGPVADSGYWAPGPPPPPKPQQPYSWEYGN